MSFQIFRMPGPERRRSGAALPTCLDDHCHAIFLVAAHQEELASIYKLTPSSVVSWIHLLQVLQLATRLVEEIVARHMASGEIIGASKYSGPVCLHLPTWPGLLLRNLI